MGRNLRQLVLMRVSVCLPLCLLVLLHISQFQPNRGGEISVPLALEKSPGSHQLKHPAPVLAGGTGIEVWSVVVEGWLVSPESC